MKKLLAMMVVGVVLVGASNAMAALSGSAHDFTGETWNTNAFNTAGGALCEPCHTPHNGNQAVAPLWSRTNEVAAGDFTMYDHSSASMNSAQPAGPDGISYACLSCHDGTTALDAYALSEQGAISAEYPGTTADLGTILSNDHPISFVYNASLATTDGELNDPSAGGSSGLGGTIEEDMLDGAAGSAKMQCSSCHDPHNGASQPKLLRKSNAASGLCTTCHNK